MPVLVPERPRVRPSIDTDDWSSTDESWRASGQPSDDVDLDPDVPDVDDFDPPHDGNDNDDDGDRDDGEPVRWVTVATFWHSTRAHIAKLKLESEEIDCVLFDEHLN